VGALEAGRGARGRAARLQVVVPQRARGLGRRRGGERALEQRARVGSVARGDQPPCVRGHVARLAQKVAQAQLEDVARHLVRALALPLHQRRRRIHLRARLRFRVCLARPSAPPPRTPARWVAARGVRCAAARLGRSICRATSAAAAHCPAPGIRRWVPRPGAQLGPSRPLGVKGLAGALHRSWSTSAAGRSASMRAGACICCCAGGGRGPRLPAAGGPFARADEELARGGQAVRAPRPAHVLHPRQRALVRRQLRACTGRHDVSGGGSLQAYHYYGMSNECTKRTAPR